MNRKGFTLIELLAVIVVLGLVLLISVPIISDAYTKSKIKSEEVFVDRLTQAIDSYVKLNSDTINFNENGTGTKTVNEKDTYNITYQSKVRYAYCGSSFSGKECADVVHGIASRWI